MVAGASGAPPTKVAGAAGAGTAPTKVAGESGGPAKDATQAGGAADAAKGADAVAGGGAAPGSLAAVLEGLAAAVKALGEIVSKMKSGATGGGAAAGCDMHGGGSHVMGVQGGAAQKDQVVAKAVKAPVANASNAEDDAFEKRVLELINQERAKAGLGSVGYNGTLDDAAEKHASHMSQVGKMAHDGIGDGDPGSRIRAEGWRNAWGENVATGQTSPEQVVREWMASPTHRKNILDPSFRSMGVGYVTGANGRSYWAQEFGA
ncbi:MAG: hypothetical protein JWM86_624 [Thermoleophilia bacterium]|nr:hypothetical protein [Thermoleophilia bacterium]